MSTLWFHSLSTFYQSCRVHIFNRTFSITLYMLNKVISVILRDLSWLLSWKALTGLDRDSAHPLQLHAMKQSCCTAANLGETSLGIQQSWFPIKSIIGLWIAIACYTLDMDKWQMVTWTRYFSQHQIKKKIFITDNFHIHISFTETWHNIGNTGHLQQVKLSTLVTYPIRSSLTKKLIAESAGKVAWPLTGRGNCKFWMNTANYYWKVPKESL